MKQGSLRPKARILRTLGAELISSDKVALVELVKNAYDADASVVCVEFKGPLVAGQGAITVWDDGYAMDEATLESAWLDIGTNIKKRKTRSVKGRRVLGEKGIGRLAASRLGQRLELVTRTASSDIELTLDIDWSDFDDDELYLDEVQIGWNSGTPIVYSERGSAAKVFESCFQSGWNRGRGTSIRMSGLTKTWDRESILELRTALTRLIRPKPAQLTFDGHSKSLSPAAEFRIYLMFDENAREFSDYAGEISAPDDLTVPHYKVSGRVEADGTGSVIYEQLNPPYRSVESDCLMWHYDSQPQCGAFSFELSVWDRDRQALQDSLALINGTKASSGQLKVFREMLDDVAGVSIYRDGFRVFPFGEHGNDWLGLDLRRVQNPTMRVSNNQIIGSVFVTADGNPDLQDQSNREGFLAGRAYADLIKLVLAALSRLEKNRYDARRRDRKSSVEFKEGGIFANFDMADLKEVVRARYSEDQKLLTFIDNKSRQVEASAREVKSILKRYSRLAVLGGLVDRILHDGRNALARIKAAVDYGIEDIGSVATSDCHQISDISLRYFDKIGVASKVLQALFKQIEPFGGRKRGRPKRMRLDVIFDRVCDLFESEARSKKVALERENVDIDVNIDEADLQLVLLNLVDNAIYWTATRSDDVPKVVTLAGRINQDGTLTVCVKDTGPGIERGCQDRIFEPYYSEKPDGVGLGLSIVGNIVEDIYGGELTLVDNPEGQGALFEATFRRRVQ